MPTFHKETLAKGVDIYLGDCEALCCSSINRNKMAWE